MNSVLTPSTPLVGIGWFDRVPNATLRDITKQPPLTSKMRLARLRLFGHIARAVPLLEPAALLREPAPTAWSRPRGRPQRTWCDQLKDDLLTVSLNLDTARRTQVQLARCSVCRGLGGLPTDMSTFPAAQLN
ncbi:hypothetical protein Bbelb_159270 [Branchiostoma belcheri]|nr:hypothetical protein Bbelb_159270 [Branchiostoma belcheri]